MSRKRYEPDITLHVSIETRKMLEDIGATGQPLKHVLDDVLNNHARLILENEHLKDAAVPDELLKRLERLQKPYQTIPGVISELLELSDIVEKSQVTLPIKHGN